MKVLINASKQIFQHSVHGIHLIHPICDCSVWPQAKKLNFSNYFFPL